jgi:hypothetical protein
MNLMLSWPLGYLDTLKLVEEGDTPGKENL